MKPATPRKNIRVLVGFSLDEHAELVAAAEAEGRSLSAWIRRATLHRIRALQSIPRKYRDTLRD